MIHQENQSVNFNKKLFFKTFLPSAFREESVKGDWKTWHLQRGICEERSVNLALAKGDLRREIGKLGTCPELLTH